MFFTVLFIAATAVAQEDCPNPAIECPDNCGGAQCGRFLTAECRENPCHSFCAPNFFWRDRNMTDRCDVERCGDKDCVSQMYVFWQVKLSSDLVAAVVQSQRSARPASRARMLLLTRPLLEPSVELHLLLHPVLN